MLCVYICTNVCKQICSPMPTVYSIANMYMMCVCVRALLMICVRIVCVYIYICCIPDSACVYELRWNNKEMCSMRAAANQVIFLQSSGNLM
jgi:hypothetical protein